MASLINKARKPKFELHLTIYDLNNVPLVAGTSTIKWHMPNSMHSEHRGRTAKCSIDKINHRVLYNYSKIVPLRISIDRANNLTDYPIEFEVLQEFPLATGGRDEKIPLGYVRLNLSEYVEESENIPRRGMARNSASLDYARAGQGLSHRRQSSSKSASGAPVLGGSSPPGAPHPEEIDVVDDEAEEGIVRRYLMQDSKINSTLKIGILMVQIDGERNYIAPALKTAPMFGGIAGIMTGTGNDQQIQVEAPSEDGSPTSSNRNNNPPGPTSLSKSRDASELQDMYRRALAASWACQPGELPADECIEDIFSGGDGWSDTTRPGAKPPSRRRSSRQSVDSSHSNTNSNSGSASGDDNPAGLGGSTLRPSDIRRMRPPGHARTYSGGSSHTVMGSTTTHLGGGGGRGRRGSGRLFKDEMAHTHDGTHDTPHIDIGGSNSGSLRGRSESLASLTPTLGSDRGREGFRRPKEVDEYEEREDLVAWALPGRVA
ncbi:N-terminal C2 in EEIG1 and EHBP1 proteins-domain-containing protein [Annulohypoxylon maeteangense]|uniref:N-terminal C2 in EEIG1 and EHBP1 proteins-domain-containing protein n=1 Tax=Annulohypoxylon maeteangense TaxID=1927788 RepID=UPI002007606A|nr:N-terminal C2 in EEIG1 and EHBP1 proteins-domain-containing protein [Annulohypoxylon maeteangense]KAI0883974.1 N-terminal C2 in EEIG1 and EHBP1 proteins-domain-containing protein [Annulohypoxylon maeteangense]